MRMVYSCLLSPHVWCVVMDPHKCNIKKASRLNYGYTHILRNRVSNAEVLHRMGKQKEIVNTVKT